MIMKMIKRIAITLVIALVVLAIGVPMIIGGGSPRLARLWTRRLEGTSSVQDAVARYKVVHREFPDGTWMYGVAIGSHGNPWGGTVVTKDSNKKTHVFFGHVCVPNAPLFMAFGEGRCSSLAEGYSNLTAQARFKEQPN